ncbi:MAG TPA: DUF2474 family protein [Paraburkholderia sp.]|nr:DUF2474 family protein [Paraburkholderia sp.]
MWRRIAWFIALWVAGVATVGAVAGVLKLVLRAASH